jgi:hypothetical protein
MFLRDRSSCCCVGAASSRSATCCCAVMSAQNPDGDWPQWFMFFERDRAVRAGDSHGDIVFWPVLALAQYLIASGDASVLDERVGDATVWQHAERALALIEKRVVSGTALAAYGHGDWNDALQPAIRRCVSTCAARGPSRCTTRCSERWRRHCARSVARSRLRNLRVEQRQFSAISSACWSSMACSLATRYSSKTACAICCTRATRLPACATARSQ